MNDVFDRNKVVEILKKISLFSEKYKTLNLNNKVFNLDDEKYTLKKFFYTYAFERGGAPKKFRKKAVKILDEKYSSVLVLEGTVKEKLDEENGNEKNNPFADFRIKGVGSFEIFKTIEMIIGHNLKGAFNSIKLRGINHKIKSFYIRDVLFSRFEDEVFDINEQEFLYAFPVDVWVFEFLKSLNLPFEDGIKIKSKYGNLSKVDSILGLSVLKLCLEEKINPLRLNMGIWYFSSFYVCKTSDFKDIYSEKFIEKNSEPFNELSV